MSRPLDDRALEALARRALRDAGDLLPTSEAEVEHAERSQELELALPPGLREYRAEPARFTRSAPQPRRARVAGYALAAGLGALAAAFALRWLGPPTPTTVTAAGSELVSPTSSARSAPVPLAYRSACDSACCAGTACSSASASMRACPSGIRCASCATDNVNGGPYRLRLGSVIATEAGQRLLPLTAPLELCVAAGGGAPTCLPALGEPEGESWRLLQEVTPLQGLLVGLSLELKKRGEPAVLASWKRPVSANADVLCKGLAITLDNEGETLGRLSVFVEPTHFVELARAESVPPLLRALSHFTVTGVEPRIYESTRGGAGRFALVLGPFDKAEAESLRWQALEHGAEASVGQGLDFVGSPHAVR